MSPVFWIMAYIITMTHVCRGDPNVRRLMFDLFTKSEIEPEMRPVMRHDRNVTVHFGSSLQEVEELSENTGQMGYRIFLTMWWNDYQLRWAPSDYGGVSKLYVSPQKVWTPDIDMHNSQETNIDKSVKLVVYHDGSVLWMPPAHFKSSCAHDFRTDSYHCTLNFRSWVYPARDMDIKPLEGVADMATDDVRPSAYYSLLSAEGSRELITPLCCDDPYATIKILLRVRKKIGHPAILGKRSIPHF